MQEVQQPRVQSLRWADTLDEGMETHSSILALGNPMDRGAWRATLHGATSSQTQLKRLSISTRRFYLTGKKKIYFKVQNADLGY